MKKSISVKNKKIILGICLVAVLISISLLTIFTAIISRDYNIYDLQVNGIASQKNGTKFSVNINQSKYINVSCKLRDNRSKVFCYNDDKYSDENKDLSRVFIGGVDKEIYLVVKDENQIKKTEIVSIKNIIPENEEFTFSIDGILPKWSEQGFEISLPHGTNNIDLSNIRIGSNFSYIIYLDEERQSPVEDLKKIQVANEQTTLFVDIKNVNVSSIVKSFTITVNIEQSKANDILSLTANGVDANINGQDIEISINKSKTINLALQISEKSEYKAYFDLEKTNEIESIANIDVIDNPLNITYYLDVIAENGDIKNYKILIDFILENDTNIKYFAINGVQGEINGNEVLFLLDRTSSLELDIKTVSANARHEFYYDRTLTNKIIDEKNIDIYALQETVYQFFCLVIAQDNTENVFSATITFIPSTNCELLDLRINNKAAKIENGLASMSFEGTIETFELSFNQIKVSHAAQYKIFYDKLCSYELEKIESIKLTSAFQSFFIKVVAENGENNFVCEVRISLISNDNALKSITINTIEYPIIADEEDIIIDSDDTITINLIKHDVKAEVSLYYDILQTKPVLDINNINYDNNRAELYLRVVAENLSVKVYFIRIEIKIAPTIIFNYSNIQLQEWQTKLKISELFSIENNAYHIEQFDTEIFWNGVKQATDYISISNEQRFYDLQVKVISPYFDVISSTKAIQILAYSLRPISASMNVENIETKEEALSFTLKQLINISDGSYTIGKDYYVEIWSGNNDIQVVVDKDSKVTLKGGVYKIYINAFRSLFNSIKVGEITVNTIEKVKPIINAPALLEYEVSNQQIKIADLFEIIKNDYEILLCKTFANGVEVEYITCKAGMYNIMIQAFYNGGMIEKSLVIEVASISDNTSVDIFVNELKMDFSDDTVILEELNYNENISVEARNYNSKASAKLFVNGVEVNFGGVILASGNNIIKILITAESGATQEYNLQIAKRERRLPTIETIDKTIKLEKNQSYIAFGDYYSVRVSDYNVTVKVYYNGNEVFGNVIQVENINKIYAIEIRLTGEFGTISKLLNIGVLQYTSIDIMFNSTHINKKADYIYSEKDFTSDIIFYGINFNQCTTYVLINGEKFVAQNLTAGLHYITVQIWQDDLLLKEESIWFTIIHIAEDTEKVVATLKNRETIITSKVVIANVNDFFVIEYGNYDPAFASISFIYNESGVPQSEFRLNAGNNHIMLIIRNNVDDIELFRSNFTIKCNYIARSEDVFSSISINNAKVSILGNDAIIINKTAPLENISLAFIPNNGIIVHGIELNYALQPGINTINYYVQEGVYSFTGTLNIYNLCELDYYLSKISYNGILAENNILLLDDGTDFNLDLLDISYNESTHIVISKQMKQVSANIYDITISAKYDGFAIGHKIVRVFIGKQIPRLLEIVSRINGAEVVYYGVNDYGIELIAVTDASSFGIGFVFSDNKYTASVTFNNLTVGENILQFSILENGVIEYTYDIKITLFPLSIVDALSYDGTIIENVNDKYILSGAEIDLTKISYNLVDSVNGIVLATNIKEVLYNNIVVGYKYEIIFNFVTIKNFSVMLDNSNLSVAVGRDGKELAQSGSALFKDKIEVEKNSNGKSLLKYTLKPVYPLATVEGYNVTSDELGYLLTLDISDYCIKNTGVYTTNCTFTVYGVTGSMQYTISIEITVIELSESNADLIVSINDSHKLLFLEKDLVGSLIISKNTAAVSIFDKTVTVKITNALGYSIYLNGVAVDSIMLGIVYNGSRYYFEFLIGKETEFLSTMRIFLSPYVDDGNNIIETALKVTGEQILFNENATTRCIDYLGKTYSVLVANKTLTLPSGTTEIYVECFGSLLEDGNFVFSNGVISNKGMIEIIDDKILLVYNYGGEDIPYGIIDVEFS